MNHVKHSFLLVCFLLAACGGHESYRGEGFAGESPYRREYPAEAGSACSAARTVLLGEGYLIADLRAERLVQARKDFQPDEDHHVTIEMNVVCQPKGAQSLVFASATQNTYALKKSRSAASISVPSVGALSLPWGQSSEELAKVAGETVSDPKFYQRFFAALETQLGVAHRSNR